VFTPPDDIDPDDVRVAVRDGWRFDPVALEYQAVGFGSHHWLATGGDGSRRFVTVDVLGAKRGGFDGLNRALDSAYRLRHEARLPFVIAAELAGDGSTLRHVGDAHAVAMYEIVDGTSLASGPFPSNELRESVLRLVAAMHAATPAVIDVADRDDFGVAARDGLERALEELDREWDGGPYADPTRGLLAEHATAVRRGLATYDRLVRTVMASDAPWVITHGEPHAQNVMITDDGPVLIDWDTALIGPPERDLWMLTSDGDDLGLDAYSEIAGHRPNRDAVMLYRLWWALCEVAGYTAEFRRPHRDTEDSRVAWDNLCDHIALVERWG